MGRTEEKGQYNVEGSVEVIGSEIGECIEKSETHAGDRPGQT